MLHFSGITQVASDQARVRKILISDLYAKVKAKGSSRCQKQWEFFSTILEVCVWFVLSFFELLFLSLHKNARFKALLL